MTVVGSSLGLGADQLTVPGGAVQPVNSPRGATADETGTAVFTFDAIAPSQILTVVCNCPSAPSTAVFVATTGTTQQGQWRGANVWGPIQLLGGYQLVVTATGLVPGETYSLNYQGVAVISGNQRVEWPTSYASDVASATEQIFLAGPIAAPEGSLVWSSPLWRSLWVVTVNGSTPLLSGEESGLNYEAYKLPYLQSPAQFWRFPLITGLDSVLELEIEESDTYYYGADLADVDSTVVTASGGAPGVTYYDSLTGAGETSTPGDLTQLGGFTVTDAAGDGITLSTAGFLSLESTASTIQIGDNPSGTITIFNYAENFDVICSNVVSITATDITLGAVDNIVLNCSKIGIMGAAGSPVGPQVSGGTLPGVIAGLVALGLFSS